MMTKSVKGLIWTENLSWAEFHRNGVVLMKIPLFTVKEGENNCWNYYIINTLCVCIHICMYV